MQSRMNKYQSSDKKKFERARKNTKLYDDVYDDIYRDTTYKNMEVIDSAKEININKLKDMLDDKYDTRQYRTLNNYSVEDIELDAKPKTISNRSKRVYDINKIITDAKQKRTFIEEAKEKQKYMDYTKKRNSKYEDKYKDLKKEEKELEELINTMVLTNKKDKEDALDLFSDLKGEDNTVVTNPIKSDLNKTVDDTMNTNTNTSTNTNSLSKTLIKADKTFYTDSNMFTKNDFEDFSSLSRNLKSSGRKRRIMMISAIVIILLVVAYLVITNFIIKK